MKLEEKVFAGFQKEKTPEIWKSSWRVSLFCVPLSAYSPESTVYVLEGMEFHRRRKMLPPPLNSIFLDRPMSSLLTLKIFGVNSDGTFYSFIFLQFMLPVGLCTLTVFLFFS